MDNWIFWVVTTVFLTMMGALAWFIKRTISNFEASITNVVKTFGDQTDKLERRIAAQEERHNQLIKDLPSVYAYREDMIRYSQDTNSRLDRLQDLMLGFIKGGQNNG